MSDLDCTPPECFSWGTVNPVFHVTLAGLAGTIQSFRNFRKTLLMPDMTNPFIHRLFGTYQSYLPEDRFAYDLEQRPDNRGSLAELLKSPPFGQIFISRTKPGITRGDHYHDLKVEKFCVVEGKAIIRFRHILGKEIIQYPVSGEDFRVVDIPPGYTHSIENVGDGTLVTLFWADEVLDPERPDTYFEKVEK
jgi:UDP-2-acetamido-2,6-beta-L-arabino-hexul-4-ose reductase